MIQKSVNKFEELKNRLEKEGNVHYYNSAEDKRKQEEMNTRLDEYSRELRLMEARSEIESSEFILTA